MASVSKSYREISSEVFNSMAWNLCFRQSHWDGEDKTMNNITQFLQSHGGPVLFVVVFIEQIGLPLPAVPWLLVAGALAAGGKLSASLAVGVTFLACITADSIWFYLGRRSGHRVLGLLCRISLEPDSCVRRTQDVFSRYGMRGLVVAKFLPGLSTLAPPLAGNAGISLHRFLFFDGIGSLLYVGTFIMVGVLFSRQLDQVMAAFGSLGAGALALVAVLAGLYIGYKYVQRLRVLHELKMARITVDELYQKVEAGENPMILDLRPRSELDQDPSSIRGALHMTMDEVERRQIEIPRDRDVILYCSCPNEVSSARIALWLHRKGISRVRPLKGGIDAWRERNYPVDMRTAGVT
jgi:membrane protein DedA with SNARE-associated domain/rhodanese-related sulfurtransferase